LETGRYQPSLDVLKKLAEALEVSVEHLVSENEQGIEKTEVQIRNKPLAERIRLIDSMEEADQQALLRVIDSMLTKQRMRRLLEESPVSAAS
jgi:transcriptional regulator with XRE-family HTH domain